MTFDELIREHGPALWRAIGSYAARGAERDDLAQDVMVAVWQALPQFRGDGSPRSFVLRIAHNRCLTYAWRRAKTRTEPEPPDVPDSRPSAHDELERSQRTEQFLRHLRRLPLGQRQVLALALEGLTHAEIAAIAGITRENVAVRLGRARAALRRSIEQEEAA